MKNLVVQALRQVKEKTKGKLKQTLQLIHNNKLVIGIIFFYLLKVYGSLALYELGLISAFVWKKMHLIGVQVIYILFTWGLRPYLHGLLYSILMGMFTARLITRAFYDSFEYWREMPLVIISSVMFYFITPIIIKLINSYVRRKD